MAKVKFAVLIQEDHLDHFEKITKALQKKGMTIENELKATGIVVGSADEKNLPAISDVTGVASVEKEQAYQLPPPESDIQ